MRPRIDRSVEHELTARLVQRGMALVGVVGITVMVDLASGLVNWFDWVAILEVLIEPLLIPVRVVSFATICLVHGSTTSSNPTASSASPVAWNRVAPNASNRLSEQG